MYVKDCKIQFHYKQKIFNKQHFEENHPIMLRNSKGKCIRIPNLKENSSSEQPVEIPGLPTLAISFDSSDYRFQARNFIPYAVRAIENEGPFEKTPPIPATRTAINFAQLQDNPLFKYGCKTLHYVLETYADFYDYETVLTRCLDIGNFQAASKVAFLDEHYGDSLSFQLKALKKYMDTCDLCLNVSIVPKSESFCNKKNELNKQNDISCISNIGYGSPARELSTSSSLDSLQQWGDEIEHQGGRESPCEFSEFGDIRQNMSYYVQSFKNDVNLISKETNCKDFILISKDSTSFIKDSTSVSKDSSFVAKDSTSVPKDSTSVCKDFNSKDSTFVSNNSNSKDLNSKDFNTKDFNSTDFNSKDVNYKDFNSKDVNSKDVSSKDFNSMVISKSSTHISRLISSQPSYPEHKSDEFDFEVHVKDEKTAEIIKIASSLIEFYIKKTYATENHILMQNILMKSIEFWLSNGLPVCVLEKILLKNMDKYFYPLSILLFCKNFCSSSDDKNEDERRRPSGFLKDFSTKFCLQLCSMVLENVNKA